MFEHFTTFPAIFISKRLTCQSRVGWQYVAVDP